MDTPPPAPTCTDALDRAAALLRVMGNADRLRLLAALERAELCVGQLAEQLRIQQPTLSQQLTVLRHHRLVSTRWAGKHVYYRLAEPVAPRLALALELARLL